MEISATAQQPAETQVTQATQPGMPVFTADMIPPIACSIGAGFAGRHYFGGMGGALLGVAIYSVFLKPLIFPKGQEKNVSPI